MGFLLIQLHIMIDAEIIKELQDLCQPCPDSSVSVDQPGKVGTFCTIPLSQGKLALVDNEDYEFINLHVWSAQKSSSTGNIWYAVRAICLTPGPNVVVRMHISIMETPPGYEIHHRNGDGLDNRKENLLICTRLEHAKYRKRS